MMGESRTKMRLQITQSNFAMDEIALIANVKYNVDFFTLMF